MPILSVVSPDLRSDKILAIDTAAAVPSESESAVHFILATDFP